jgi:hypothetical protein
MGLWRDFLLGMAYACCRLATSVAVGNRQPMEISGPAQMALRLQLQRAPLGTADGLAWQPPRLESKRDVRGKAYRLCGEGSVCRSRSGWAATGAWGAPSPGSRAAERESRLEVRIADARSAVRSPGSALVHLTRPMNQRRPGDRLVRAAGATSLVAQSPGSVRLARSVGDGSEARAPSYANRQHRNARSGWTTTRPADRGSGSCTGLARCSGSSDTDGWTRARVGGADRSAITTE